MLIVRWRGESVRGEIQLPLVVVVHTVAEPHEIPRHNALTSVVIPFAALVVALGGALRTMHQRAGVRLRVLRAAQLGASVILHLLEVVGALHNRVVLGPDGNIHHRRRGSVHVRLVHVRVGVQAALRRVSLLRTGVTNGVVASARLGVRLERFVRVLQVKLRLREEGNRLVVPLLRASVIPNSHSNRQANYSVIRSTRVFLAIIMTRPTMKTIGGSSTRQQMQQQQLPQLSSSPFPFPFPLAMLNRKE